MEQNLPFAELIRKVELLKQTGAVDLSTEEDLSIAIMNLVSLEEHFFFTGAKTGEDSYYDHMHTIRELRKSLLKRMISSHEGEEWCISKHLLAATMRLIEVGTKLHHEGRQDEAKDMFANAYTLYTLFFAIRLKLVDVTSLKKISDNALNIHDTEGGATAKSWNLKDIMAKLVNCCDE